MEEDRRLVRTHAKECPQNECGSSNVGFIGFVTPEVATGFGGDVLPDPPGELWVCHECKELFIFDALCIKCGQLLSAISPGKPVAGGGWLHKKCPKPTNA
jgi:hypothetical protein